MKKIIKIIILVSVAAFLIIWIAALAKCEILTLKHGHEFDDDLFKENTMIGEKEYIKILYYTDSCVNIYYVGKNMAYADVITFEKKMEHGYTKVIIQYGRTRAVLRR